jgi:hypothetical protein
MVGRAVHGPAQLRESFAYSSAESSIEEEFRRHAVRQIASTCSRVMPYSYATSSSDSPASQRSTTASTGTFVDSITGAGDR